MKFCPNLVELAFNQSAAKKQPTNGCSCIRKDLGKKRLQSNIDFLKLFEGRTKIKDTDNFVTVGELTAKQST
jgi:hypothetical protein